MCDVYTRSDTQKAGGGQRPAPVVIYCYTPEHRGAIRHRHDTRANIIKTAQSISPPDLYAAHEKTRAASCLQDYSVYFFLRALPWIAAAPVGERGDRPVHHLGVRVRAGRGAPRRRGLRLGWVLPREGALGPRPAACLEVEGVVVDEEARQVVDALVGRLRLQLPQHEVADAQPCRR